MNAVDTNVLIYIHDSRDLRKQLIAENLVDTLEDRALLWQVACEYIAASKKLRSLDYTQEKAWNDIKKLQQSWYFLMPSPAVFSLAEKIHLEKKFSFWDALIIAACIDGKIETLYSENFEEQTIQGVRLVNPFK